MAPSCQLLGRFAISAWVACYGSVKPTRNVSEYMLVLVLCLVAVVAESLYVCVLVGK